MIPRRGTGAPAGGGNAGTKQSVAVAIREPARPGAVLVVQRPPDDEELPGVWGLPAASLLAGESWHDAVRRAGRDKLGVDLEVGPMLNAGTAARSEYTLDMRLYAATIVRGTPAVPQPVAGVTQYAAWRWGTTADLQPAVQRGSLCGRLYIEGPGDGG